MITKVDNIQSVGIGFKYPTEFFGLSTDTKPTDTANGSVFTEIDSGKKYMFDFAGSQWCEIPAAENGGGGGSSDAGVLVVHEVAQNSGAKSGESKGSPDPPSTTYVLDRTWKEINEAIPLAVVEVGDEYDGVTYTMKVGLLAQYSSTGEYSVFPPAIDLHWDANSENGYPSRTVVG